MSLCFVVPAPNPPPRPRRHGRCEDSMFVVSLLISCFCPAASALPLRSMNAAPLRRHGRCNAHSIFPHPSAGTASAGFGGHFVQRPCAGMAAARFSCYFFLRPLEPAPLPPLSCLSSHFLFFDPSASTLLPRSLNETFFAPLRRPGIAVLRIRCLSCLCSCFLGRPDASALPLRPLTVTSCHPPAPAWPL